MRLSEFIKNYREEAELSQRQFALKCGLSNGYISLLESEVNPQTGKPIVPTIPQLSKLAFGMSISLNELIDQVEDIPIELASSSLADQIKPVEVRKLPVLGKVACGEPLFMDEEREYIDIKDAPRNVDFILIAKGDSMINAGIKDGDYVFIEKRSSVNNGEIAVVVIDDEATLKRVHFDKEKQVLQLLPENPSYAPMIYMGEELERIQVLGKAIAVMSLLK